MANKKSSAALTAPSDESKAQERMPSVKKTEGGAAPLLVLFNRIDDYLNASPLAQQAAAFTGLRPCVLFCGFVLFMIISLGSGFGGGLVCDVAGFLYPAWMSFRAVESPAPEDDKLWLTYWVVYSAFSVFEYFIDFILFWLPFYYLAKFCFLLYLALPCFKGAQVVYNVFVRPFLLEHQEPIDACVNQLGDAGVKAAENLQQAMQEGLSLVNQAVGAVRRKPL